MIVNMTVLELKRFTCKDCNSSISYDRSDRNHYYEDDYDMKSKVAVGFKVNNKSYCDECYAKN